MPTMPRFTTRHTMLLPWILLLAAVVVPVRHSSFAAETSQHGKTETLPPPAILSIVPAQAEPGSRVMIFGSAFGDRISAYLGDTEIPAKVSGGRQLEFTVPALDPGLYALYLKRGDGVAGRVYNFTVLPLRPILKDLSPDRIDSCAQGKDRQVTAMGEHFTENSLLLFDGAVIKSRVLSPETIAFTVPQVAGGLHQVVVRNGQDNASVAVALAIETKPEISQITVGNEYVNYYELVIDGRNFQQNSVIYVDGQRIGGRGGLVTPERDRLVYVDCTRLLYLRYPYSPVTKNFNIQVVNPGNEASQMVSVTAP
ncbi:MAG TPA: IPT/TIG domain-containing protein [Desulfuromonadaceae bacterium]